MQPPRVTFRKPLVEAIETRRSGDLLAERLRAAILDGEVEAGETLPPERALAESSGLSRGSVREALRVLEAEGLVRPRPGRGGGAVVTAPGDGAMARMVDGFVRSRRLPLRVIQEARETIEPALARLAAAGRTGPEMAYLESLAEGMEAPGLDQPGFARLNLRWHETVARASRNELLGALLHAMSGGMMASTSEPGLARAELRAEANAAHRAINRAIAAQDGDAAFRRMERHIRAYRETARAQEEAEMPMDPPPPES